ncbi:MAG: helix-turn-helix domain-containing protein [Pirellulaceae bacterium]|nr:helix-turn-helix domain-containing protein [Pirellulaceae bacterium]
MSTYTSLPTYVSQQRLLYSVVEAAEVLSLSRSKVYELLAANTLQSVKIGRSRRIPHSALTDYVASLSNS